MRIAIIAALPGELRPLVRGWQPMSGLPSKVRMWQRVKGDSRVVAVCAGMGMEAARRAFAAAELSGAVDLAMSVGWAGGLAGNPGPGAMVPTEVIDAQTGERFRVGQETSVLRLVTTSHVADAGEKRRLAASYSASLVDMEAAAIARLAQIRGIPFRCIKAVSDDAEAKLPDLNRFIDGAGQMRMGAFLGYVALRPAYWGSLLALGRRSAWAAEALARAIEEFLVEKDVEETVRRGEV